MTGLSRRDLFAHLLRHPGDLGVVLESGWTLRRASWWRRRPFLPTPAHDYWHFRVTTAQGGAATPLSAPEIVAAARWARALRRQGRGR